MIRRLHIILLWILSLSAPAQSEARTSMGMYINYHDCVNCAAAGGGDVEVSAAWTSAAGANNLTISNTQAGMFGLIKVTNSGSSKITLPTGAKVINGGAGVVPLAQVVSAVDILTFYYDGTNYWWTHENNYN